ncbi:MAG: hypothetical protein RBG13Loki_0392 [Promethearchaeota archaeon CR_4]|nr:MAG: hypothetical protein RBG13Loki_0392 [Candidatus Lokiarchaeota archaeon CR_4]
MKTTIAIERTTQDVISVRSSLNKLLTNLGADSIFAGKKRILLKPNLLIPKPPDAGITTHPEVVAAMIDWLVEYGIVKEDIVVAESSSTFSSNVTRRAFNKCGIQEVCESRGVRWTPFEGTKMVRVDLPTGKMVKFLNISEELVRAEVVINLPILKTHNLTVITAAIKNMFGSLVLTNKTDMHARFPAYTDFAEMLVDVYSVSKPSLTIVDGITAMEGNGPGAGGKLVELGLLLAGTDPVAIDTICAEIMGFDQRLILSTQAAARRGLGTNNVAEIEIAGVSLDEIRRKFKFPGTYKLYRFIFNSRIGHTLAPLMKKFTGVRAWYDKKTCVSCGDCVNICPGHALKIQKVGSTPTWTKEKCINCHCCEEICPKGAAHVGIAGINGIWPYLIVFLTILVTIIWFITRLVTWS